MKPYQQRKEVKLISCPDCKGKGSIKDEDSSEAGMCLRCGGVGEIIDKIVPARPFRPGRIIRRINKNE